MTETLSTTPSAEQEIAEKRARERDRKRKSRASQKAREEYALEEAIARYTRTKRLVGFGEIEHGVFARNEQEWILCARRFARAANLEDIRQGESINDFESRIYGHVCTRDTRTKRNVWTMPLLNLTTGKFDERYEVVLYDHVNSGVRYFLPEHDQPIDITTLPALPAPTGPHYQWTA